MSPYQKGREAFELNQPDTENPYREGDQAFIEWDKGYTSKYNAQVNNLEVLAKGHKAFHDDKPSTKNPYAPLTKTWLEWKYGWEKAYDEYSKLLRSTPISQE